MKIAFKSFLGLGLICLLSTPIYADEGPSLEDTMNWIIPRLQESKSYRFKDCILTKKGGGKVSVFTERDDPDTKSAWLSDSPLFKNTKQKAATRGLTLTKDTGNLATDNQQAYLNKLVGPLDLSALGRVYNFSIYLPAQSKATTYLFFTSGPDSTYAVRDLVIPTMDPFDIESVFRIGKAFTHAISLCTKKSLF